MTAGRSSQGGHGDGNRGGRGFYHLVVEHAEGMFLLWWAGASDNGMPGLLSVLLQILGSLPCRRVVIRIPPEDHTWTDGSFQASSNSVAIAQFDPPGECSQL